MLFSPRRQTRVTNVWHSSELRPFQISGRIRDFGLSALAREFNLGAVRVRPRAERKAKASVKRRREAKDAPGEREQTPMSLKLEVKVGELIVDNTQ